MKIIITIIVLAILALAFVGAVSLGIIDEDFKDNVVSISTDKICQVEMLSARKFCDKNTKDEVDVDPNVLSIKEDPKTGGIRVRNE